MTPPSSPRAGRSTVSAAGEPPLRLIVDITPHRLLDPQAAADLMKRMAKPLWGNVDVTVAAASPAGPEAVPQSERGGLRAALEPYLRHLPDCAYIQPVDETPWKSVPCTCPKELWWGDHEVGCPRAAAFRSFMDDLIVPDCSCGLVALASPAHPDEE